MLIVAFDLHRDPHMYPDFFAALNEAGGLEAGESFWVVPHFKAASAFTDTLLEHLEEGRDRLFVAVLNELGEFGWMDPLCGDATLGEMIRDERESQ